MKNTRRKNFGLILALCLLAAACSGQKTAQQRQNPQTKVADRPAQTPGPTVFNPSLGEIPEAATTSPKSTPPPPPSSTPVPKNVPPPPTDCGSNFDCYQTYYQGLVKDFGVATAFVELKQQYPTNSYVQAQCHPITHIIGQAAIQIYPTISEAYTHGDSYCWSGYYHGVMEGIVAKVGRNNFLAGLNNYCSDLPGKATYSFDYFNCVHGLGHGVMAYSNDELFDSLKYCDQLNGDWEKTSCYGGVFMENVIVDNKNHFTKYLKPSDLLYPCDAVDQPYKQQCYIMQTSYALKENGGDFPGTFVLCEKSDAGFEATCDQSLGRDASSRSNYNLAGIKTICMMGNNIDQQSNCVIGAVKDVISFYHSDVQAKQFCASLDTGLQAICNSTEQSYYQSF